MQGCYLAQPSIAFAGPDVQAWRQSRGRTQGCVARLLISSLEAGARAIDAAAFAAEVADRAIAVPEHRPRSSHLGGARFA
jgi:hypothetical protein